MSVTPGTAPSLSTSLPVLDLAALQARDPDALAALRGAAHAVGFLSLVGTGLAGERTEQVLAAARALLDLPEAEKAAGASYDSPQFRGWTRTGAELTGGRPDRREQIDVGRDETTLPGPLTGDRVGLRLRGPNRWPRGGEAHAAVVTAWLADVERVGLDLLDALLAALGLPPDALAPLLAGGTDDGGADGDGRGHLHAKLLRYPPEPGVQAQGVGAHRDYGLLALLVQDGVGGLQAQLPGDGGAWVDVAPRPDAVVVNLGEMLEVLTDGYLVATPHRVVSPRERTRHSVAVFLGPRLDAVVRPLDLPDDVRAAARGVSADPANPLHPLYGANSLKGWLRAHPETARRHHADLLTPVLEDA